MMPNEMNFQILIQRSMILYMDVQEVLLMHHETHILCLLLLLLLLQWRGCSWGWAGYTAWGDCPWPHSFPLVTGGWARLARRSLHWSQAPPPAGKCTRGCFSKPFGAQIRVRPNTAQSSSTFPATNYFRTTFPFKAHPIHLQQKKKRS